MFVEYYCYCSIQGLPDWKVIFCFLGAVLFLAPCFDITRLLLALKQMFHIHFLRLSLAQTQHWVWILHKAAQRIKKYGIKYLGILLLRTVVWWKKYTYPVPCELLVLLLPS